MQTIANVHDVDSDLCMMNYDELDELELANWNGCLAFGMTDRATR